MMFTSKLFLYLSLCFFLAMLSVSIAAASLPTSPSLRVGFYNKTCPCAETTVRDVVKSAIAKDSGLGAGLIRMHFHDCFVRGCDASILLDSTPGHPAEKEHFINKPSLRGFEVIDDAKLELEAQCPQTVSCADIIAFASRESAYQLGGIYYPVQSERRDGQHSLENEPLDNLPPPFSSLKRLKEFFQRKGLSLEDMVILSGAHSIGVSHCSSFSSRLFPSNTTDEPRIDPHFARMLRLRCPKPSSNTSSGVDNIVYEDFVTPFKLDNQYYHNVLSKRALFKSDQMLLSSHETAKMVKKFSKQGDFWARKFAKAMLKMESIEVLTGMAGEIRTSCRAVNSF